MSVIVVMDHGLAAIAVFIFLLDHCLALGGSIAFLDNSRAIAIAIMIMRFANGHTSADGARWTPTSSAIAGAAIAVTSATAARYFFICPPTLRLQCREKYELRQFVPGT